MYLILHYMYYLKNYLVFCNKKMYYILYKDVFYCRSAMDGNGCRKERFCHGYQLHLLCWGI